MTKECISKKDSEATFIGYDFGHKPDPNKFTYKPATGVDNWPPDNIVAVIVNVIQKGFIMEEHWNDKRGPSPADTYFMDHGNR